MPDKLTDGEAKEILREWPERTVKWPTPTGRGYWLRAQPRGEGTRVPTPRLSAPGATRFRTQPDGMWVFIEADDEYADVIAIEVCGSRSNLNDKRSRYASGTSGLILKADPRWLAGKISVQRGGSMPRWRAMGTFSGDPGGESDEEFYWPVRHLRVLYSLPKKLYGDWKKSHAAAGHEFYCRHSSLSTYSSQAFQEFLSHLSVRSHFYTRT